MRDGSFYYWPLGSEGVIESRKGVVQRYLAARDWGSLEAIVTPTDVAGRTVLTTNERTQFDSIFQILSKTIFLNANKLCSKTLEIRRKTTTQHLLDVRASKYRCGGYLMRTNLM